jgi:hypothetical protein
MLNRKDVEGNSHGLSEGPVPTIICCKDGGKSYKTTVMIADFKAGILTLDLQALTFSGKG